MVAIDKVSVEPTTASKPLDGITHSTKPATYKNLVVIIPAYNEARFIGSVVLQSLQFTSQVIVVDDGSTDSTAQIARCAGAVVVAHECNQGFDVQFLGS